MIKGTEAGIIRSVHERQRRLCDNLESFADRLAAPIGPQELSALADELEETMAQARTARHLLVKRLTGPHGRASPLAEQGPTLQRLLREAEEDACYAEDLHEVLRAMASGADPACTETLGYMVRSFFVAVRRRVALESELFDLAVAPAPRAPAVLVH